MRVAPTFLLLLFTISNAAAQSIQGITINSYGIYTADLTKNVAAQSTAAGSRDLANNIRLVTTTQLVPGEIGVRFGFTYTVAGSPNGSPVRLKMVTIYPPSGLRNPASPQLKYRGEYINTKKIGATGFTGYTLDDPWEVVPGKWTFEIWDGDRKLASQSFTVVKQ